VYRGIRDLPAYKNGDLLVWWGFSITTRRFQQTETFLNFAGPRAKFIIENAPCVNIEEFSAFPEEFERFLFPGTALKVLSTTPEFDDGRRDVQVEFVKGQAVFDFMHPDWPIDLFNVPGKFLASFILFIVLFDLRVFEVLGAPKM
jgi:hypothetical protein